MDYHETLVTLGTQDTGQKQTKFEHTTQKTKKMNSTNPINNQKQNIILIYTYYSYLFSSARRVVQHVHKQMITMISI